MASTLVATVYWGGMLLLFFFWAYGIASFALDLKNKIIPGIIRYRRGKQAEAAEREREQERDEREQQLY